MPPAFLLQGFSSNADMLFPACYLCCEFNIPYVSPLINNNNHYYFYYFIFNIIIQKSMAKTHTLTASGPLPRFFVFQTQDFVRRWVPRQLFLPQTQHLARRWVPRQLFLPQTQHLARRWVPRQLFSLLTHSATVDWVSK